jgi:cellulose synthase operon protein C
MVSYAKNNITDARNYLSEFVQKDPSNAGAHALLGSIMMNRGETKKAIELLRTARIIAPDNPQILRLLGMTFMQAGDHQSAEMAFQKAITESSRTSSVHTMLALSHVRRGQNEAAINGLEAILRDDEKAANAGVMLGLVYLQEKKFDEAMRVARIMTKRLPNNPVPYNLMGVAQWGKNEITGARESLNRALEIDPNYVSAQSNLAKIEASLGETESAQARLKTIQKLPGVGIQPLIELARIAASKKQYEAAFKFLETARSLDIGNRNLKLSLIDMYLAAGRTDLAVQSARQLRNQGPDDLSTLERLGRAELAAGLTEDAKATFLRLAELSPSEGKMLEPAARYLMRVGDQEGARKTLVKATLFDPDHLASHISLIRLEMKMELYDKALQRSNALIAKLPKQPVAYNLKGDVLLKTGKLKKAIRAYEAGLRIEESGPLLIRLQLAHSALGNPKASFRRIKRWAAENPTDVPVRRVVADVYIGLKNTKAAIAEYEDLRNRELADADILNNLAWLYQQKNDDRALETAEEAYRLAPQNARVLDTLGWILVRDESNTARGLDYLRDAYSRAANRPAIRYHLAVALSQLDRKEDALNFLDGLLKFGGKGDIYEKAKLLRERLRQ